MPSPPPLPAAPASRRQQFIAGFSALVQAIPLKLHGAVLMVSKHTVLNQSLLASIAAVVVEGKRQLEGLSTNTAEGEVQFLDVAKELMGVLQNIGTVLQGLTLTDLLHLQSVDVEVEPQDINIDFFGIKFSVSTRQYNALIDLLSKVSASHQGLRNVSKEFVKNALQLTPLTSAEKEALACEWTLRESELHEIHRDNPKRREESDEVHEQVVNELIIRKIKEKIVGRLSSDELRKIRAEHSSEIIINQAIIALVQKKLTKEAVKKKIEQIVNDIFNGPRPWILEFSSWMSFRQKKGSLTAFKPFLTKILSENNGVQAMIVLIKSFQHITELFQAGLKDRTRKPSKTVFEKVKSILPVYLGGSEPDLAAESKYYDFSSGLFTDEMADLIDKSSIASKENIGLLFDSLNYGAEVFKIWTKFLRAELIALNALPEESDSDQNQFLERLNELTKKVFINEADRFFDAKETLDDSDSIQVTSLIDDEELCVPIQESLTAIHGLAISWRFSKKVSKETCVDDYVTDCFENGDDLKEVFKSIYLEEGSKKYIPINPQPSPAVISFSQKILAPAVFLLDDLVGFYERCSECDTEGSVKNKQSVRKQIMAVAFEISKIAKSPLLLNALSKKSVENILLVLQEQYQSLVENLAGQALSEDNIGISVGILTDLQNAITRSAQPVLLPESSDKVYWDTAKQWASPLIALNDYLYKRATETRYWHYFAFKWRNRLRASIDIYRDVLAIVRPEEASVLPEQRDALFERKKMDMVGKLGWLQLNYGGIWVDHTFFSDKRPKNVWLRGLSFLSFFATVVWSGWNVLSGLLLWRGNTFANCLKTIQNQMINLENTARSKNALSEQLQVVLEGLNKIKDDLSPNAGADFRNYLNLEERSERLPFKKRKEILTQYHLLSPAESTDLETVDPSDRWTALLKPAGNRPSLAENQFLYGIRRFGLGG